MRNPNPRWRETPAKWARPVSQVVVLALVAFAACSPHESEDDAGSSPGDSGNLLDGGAGVDSGPGGTDAGPTLDGGTSPDAGVDAGPVRSLREFAACDGTTDDNLATAKAFAAARHHAFTLRVDCPAWLHVGTDLGRQIYVDDGTVVDFADGGVFIVDNTLVPTFGLVDVNDVTFTNWRVEYRASLPLDYHVDGGYYDNGTFVPKNGACLACDYTDGPLTNYLRTHRGVIFDQSLGKVGATWVGPTNNSATFYLVGSTSHVTITGMRLYVPPTANGNQFAPMVFSMTPGYVPNQTVTALDGVAPYEPPKYSVPNHILFDDIDLDGYYMGWQGGAQDLTIHHVRAHRYGDWQDVDGGTPGGTGKWFAPPHLIYLPYDYRGDGGLFNRNLQISDVNDLGPRIGIARDRGGTDPGSGYALSLKIGGVDSKVDGYTSSRPDGLLDVLASDNLTLANINATYDSSFLNNIYPGLRFPGIGTTRNHLTLQNVSLADLATHPVIAPMSGANDLRDSTFTNVLLTVARWDTAEIAPVFSPLDGGNDLHYDYLFADAGSGEGVGETYGVTTRLNAGTVSVHVGDGTLLSWSSVNATGCVASGGWAGSLAPSGTQAQIISTAGDHALTLTCTGPWGSSSATLHVTGI
jgi:hypothetical protein